MNDENANEELFKRRTVMGSIAGVGATSLGRDAVLQRGEGDAKSDKRYALEDGTKLPPLFDCNAWVGTTDVSPIAFRLYRPPGADDAPAHLIDLVGADKVFFGTDIPRSPQSQVGWATYERLDPEARRKHMRENGLELLNGLGVLPDAYRDEV